VAGSKAWRDQDTAGGGVPSPHLCDQAGLFNDFRYKKMPPS
jgi:hypothetical protein